MLENVINVFLGGLVYLFYGTICSAYHLLLKISITLNFTLKCIISILIFPFNIQTKFLDHAFDKYDKSYNELRDYEEVFYPFTTLINILTIPLFYYCYFLYLFISFIPKLIVNKYNSIQYLERNNEIIRKEKEVIKKRQELLQKLKAPEKVLTLEEIIKQNEKIENNCLICLESLKNEKNKTLECNHIFHTKCLEEWLIKNQTCPLCRSNVELNIRIDIPNLLLND